jgi:hypothetical protein
VGAHIDGFILYLVPGFCAREQYFPDVRYFLLRESASEFLKEQLSVCFIPVRSSGLHTMAEFPLLSFVYFNLSGEK